MLDIKVLNKIRKEALSNIKKDSDGEKIDSKINKVWYFFLFYLIPLLMSIGSWLNDIFISEMEKFISTGIAIFTGLFFSLLLNIGSKVNAEKNNPNKDQDNFISFKNSMIQISSITIYTIVLGIIIFLLLLINHILKTDTVIYIEKGFTALIIFIMSQFIICLFFMIQRLYFIVKDELNNIL